MGVIAAATPIGCIPAEPDSRLPIAGILSQYARSHCSKPVNEPSAAISPLQREAGRVARKQDGELFRMLAHQRSPRPKNAQGLAGNSARHVAKACPLLNSLL